MRCKVTVWIFSDYVKNVNNMKKIFIRVFISISIISVVLLALNYFKIKKVEDTVSLNKIQVATSFYPLYYLVSEIGGNKVETYNLTPSGLEPHDYEPTARDIGRMEKSKILFINGGGLEIWGGKMVSNLKSNKVNVIEVGKTFITENLEGEGRIVKDVHIWLSPEIFKKEAAIILTSLQNADIQNKDYYQLQANKLFTKLDILHDNYKKGLSACGKKDFITSHAAFGYLAKAYGLNQIPISGLSPESEPSAQQMAEVITLAKNGKSD